MAINNEMDIVVRLRDETHRSGEAIERMLKRISEASSKIGSGKGSAASGVRGLANAFKALNGNTVSDTSLQRIDRYTASINRLGAAAPELKAAGIAIRGIVRSVDAMSRAHQNFERAARNADLMSRALAKMPNSNTGFVAGANMQLKEMLRQQKEAIENMKKLNGGGGGARGGGGSGGNGNSRGGSGGGMLSGAIGYQMMDSGRAAVGDVYSQATGQEDLETRLRGQGLSAVEIAQMRRKADDIASANKSVNRLGAMNIMAEARTALSGDTQGAIALAPRMAQFQQIMQRYLPEEKRGQAMEQMYDMARSGELRNEISDPKRFDEMMKSMSSYMVFTNGRVMPRDFHKNILYGRGAAQGWSDDFVNDRLGFFAQELGNGSGGRGGPAGVALRSLFQQVVMGVQRKSARKDWQKIGMWDGNAVAQRDLATTDPDKFLKIVMDKMTAAGITDKTAQVEMLGKLFTTGTAQTAAFVGGFQSKRLDEFVRSKRAVMNPEDLQSNSDGTLTGSTQALKTQLDALAGTIGGQLLPVVTPLVKSATKLVEVANGIAKWGGIPLTVTAVGAALPLVFRTVASSNLLRGALGMGLGGFFGGPAGAMAGGAAAARVGGGLAGAAGVVGTLGGGAAVVGGALTAYGAARNASGWLTDSVMPSSIQKSNIDAYTKILADAQAVQNDPKASWFSKFLAGRRASLAQSYLEDHPMAPVDGKRALGGPVSGGKTYLVGERGPELFTPKVGGGITSNVDLNRMGESGEDGRVLAQALRYQTFELVNAINGLRASRGYTAASADGGYGSGTLSGAGGARIDDSADPDPKGPGYGRRALGRRIRGGSDGGGTVPAGPHVRLGRMGSGGKGRYAKFDAKAPAIMGGLMKKYGLTAEQAAGVVGNLGHESARFTAYHEGGQMASRGGVGWAQWTGPRRHAFERWTKAHNLDPTSDEASWRFLTEGDPETARAIAAVKKTHNRHDAMVAFEQNFERAGVKAYASRDALANRAASFKPVDGIEDKPKIPESVASKAKSDAAQRRATEQAHAKAAAGQMASHITVGDIHVHAQPHHDAEQIAEIVHTKFRDATRHSYSDGAYI